MPLYCFFPVSRARVHLKRQVAKLRTIAQTTWFNPRFVLWRSLVDEKFLHKSFPKTFRFKDGKRAMYAYMLSISRMRMQNRSLIDETPIIHIIVNPNVLEECASGRNSNIYFAVICRFQMHFVTVINVINCVNFDVHQLKSLFLDH